MEFDEQPFTLFQIRRNEHGRLYQGHGDAEKTAQDAFSELDGVQREYPCSYRLVKEHNKIKKVVLKLGDWDSRAGATVLNNLRQRMKED